MFLFVFQGAQFSKFSIEDVDSAVAGLGMIPLCLLGANRAEMLISGL